MDIEVKPLSKKSIIIRLVIIGVVVIGSGVLIGVLLINALKKNPGWYSITATETREVTGYSGMFDFNYYADGSSSEIKGTIDSLTNAYTDVLKRNYAYYNEAKEYTAYPSIAQLNFKTFGTDVTLMPSCYEDLKEAYNYTLQNKNYSLFSGPIYSFWFRLSVLDDSASQKNADPINNESNRTYIENLVKIINKPSCVVLTFKENNVVSMTLSDEYIKFRQDNGITDPIVDFGPLKEAYILKHVISEIEEKGFHNGYISNDDGLIYTFNNTKNLQLYLYNRYFKENTMYSEIFAAVINNKKLSYSSLRKFRLSQKNIGYYFKQGDQMIVRHGSINLTSGYPNDLFTNVNIYSESQNVLEVLKKNLLFNCCNTKESAIAMASELENNQGITFTLNDGSKEAYVNSYAKPFIKLNDSLKYTLIII